MLITFLIADTETLQKYCSTACMTSDKLTSTSMRYSLSVDSFFVKSADRFLWNYQMKCSDISHAQSCKRAWCCWLKTCDCYVQTLCVWYKVFENYKIDKYSGEPTQKNAKKFGGLSWHETSISPHRNFLECCKTWNVHVNAKHGMFT